MEPVRHKDCTLDAAQVLALAAMCSYTILVGSSLASLNSPARLFLAGSEPDTPNRPPRRRIA